MTMLQVGQPKNHGSIIGTGKKFPLLQSIQISFRSPKRPVQWVLGPLPKTVKRPECEADHSPSCSVEVKNEWIHTSTPACAFMASTGTTLTLPVHHYDK